MSLATVLLPRMIMMMSCLQGGLQATGAGFTDIIIVFLSIEEM